MHVLCFVATTTFHQRMLFLSNSTNQFRGALRPTRAHHPSTSLDDVEKDATLEARATSTTVYGNNRVSHLVAFQKRQSLVNSPKRPFARNLIKCGEFPLLQTCVIEADARRLIVEKIKDRRRTYCRIERKSIPLKQVQEPTQGME